MSSFNLNEKSTKNTWLHFAGVAGSGMSALAQFHALGGGLATGSDRSFDQGERQNIRQKLEGLGVIIVPQDGSFVEAGGRDKKCDAMVVSTAVEETVPDVQASRKNQVAILHRSELLAHYVSAHQTIAITGTSGKSTVTAMVYSILRGCGKNPALLTGGAVSELMAEGHIGNAFNPCASPEGEKTILVIEADESDGSVVRYHPWCGVILNLGLDHKEPAEIMEMFRTFKSNITGPLVLSEQEALSEFRPKALTFGSNSDQALFSANNIELRPETSTFSMNQVRFELNVPGAYNVDNACAALAACAQTGLELEEMVQPLAQFQGVQRRFEKVGCVRDVEVIDDFAHNPDKIEAALKAGQIRSKGRILAMFQPHGFGPTRFLKDALIETFKSNLRPEDVLWMPEIFFAGGSVQRDISSADLISTIKKSGCDARFSNHRSDLAAQIAAEAKTGDLVLVMGARDPSLTGFCHDILNELGN